MDVFGYDSIVGSYAIDACKIEGTILGLIDDKDKSQIGEIVEKYKIEIKEYFKLFKKLLDEKKLVSYAFIVSISLFSMCKTFPIHIILTNNGSASEYIISILNDFSKILSEVNYHLNYCGTEGDPKYSVLLDGTFDNFAKIIGKYINLLSSMMIVNYFIHMNHFLLQNDNNSDFSFYIHYHYRKKMKCAHLIIFIDINLELHLIRSHPNHFLQRGNRDHLYDRWLPMLVQWQMEINYSAKHWSIQQQQNLYSILLCFIHGEVQSPIPFVTSFSKFS